MKKICTKCGKEKSLKEFDKTNHNKTGRVPHCKECRSSHNKKYYKDNREKILKRCCEYREGHKEERTEQGRLYNKDHKEERAKYYQDNKEKIDQQNREWAKNNPEKHGEIMKRSNVRRKKEFGFIPLNGRFPGSVGHHISKDLVIFIPEELHKSVPHRYNDPISMGEINGLALEFIMPEIG